MPLDNPHLIFVYGTLKCGGINHPLLHSCEHRFIQTTQTINRYAMYCFGSFPVVQESPEIYPIKGELYEVDDDGLFIIDMLEGHPSLYTRKKVDVLQNGAVTSAWMYFCDHTEGNLCTTGFFDCEKPAELYTETALQKRGRIAETEGYRESNE